MEIGLLPLRCLFRMSIATAIESGAVPKVATRIAYAALLLVLIACGYSEVIGSYFLADDFNYLNIVAQAETFRDGTAVDTGWEYFRPLTALSFWFNYRCFGTETATSFHVFALVVHWFNALLVARMAWRLCPHWFAAGFAGAAFAVLPVHPECITWISARADVLCATGTLILVTGWLDYLRGHRGAAALAEVLCGLVFALLTKDSAMILPVVLVAMALIYRGRPAGQVALVFAGVVVVFVVYLVSRITSLGAFIGSQSANDAHHFTINLSNSLWFTIDALRAMLLPGPLGIRTGLGLILVLYIGLRHQALARFVRTAWPLFLVFLMELAPVANAVQLELADGTNTRFLYMPSVFFCAGLGVLVGTSLPDGSGKPSVQRRSSVLYFAAVILVVIYTVTIRQVNRPWAEASAMSRGIVTQLQGFTKGKDYRWVFIHGLPDTHEGAYVFKNGIDTAIKLFVSKTLVFPSHGKISLEDWLKWSAERRADPTAHPDSLLLRWDPVSRRLIEP